MRWKYRWKSLSTGTVISLPCACHPIRGLPSPDPSRMNTVFKASALSQALLLALVAPASLAAPADPAEPATPATPVTAVAAAPEPQQLDTVVVQAQIASHNRTPHIAHIPSSPLKHFPPL